MYLRKIRKNKKGFDPLTAVVVLGIGGILWLLFNNSPSTPEEELTPPDETCEGFCEASNPAPYDPPLDAACFSSCPDNMKRSGTCNCKNVYDDEGNIVDETCDSWCVPKSCGDSPYEGYKCTGNDVCPDCWVNPPDGCPNCCSVPCVTPCTMEQGGCGSGAISLVDYDESSVGEGFATCAYGCPDAPNLVEYNLGTSDWCTLCSGQGTHCCIYCPPKTYYCSKAQKCVGAPVCDSCENNSGLPFNLDMSSLSSYIETGFSSCSTNCSNYDLGNDVIWKSYSIGEPSDEWCKIENGGTTFEGNNKCCAYCPPGKIYNPTTLSCEEIAVTAADFKATLESCDYVLLTWGEYEEAISYEIDLFYDEDGTGGEDGSCDVDVTLSETSVEGNSFFVAFYYLTESECVEHLTGKIMFRLYPQYPEGQSNYDAYESEWLDVSHCEFQTEPRDCEDGTKDGECNETTSQFCRDGELSYDCVACPCPEGYECLGDLTCREIPSECQNNIREGLEECDGTDDDACPGRCTDECTCPDSDCEEDSDCGEGYACWEGVCMSDYDGDGNPDEFDPDQDGDEVLNPIDEEEWTPLGCEVNEKGEAIDNDEDGYCLGLDCNDYDDSVQITKDDPACTRDILCFNKEKDEQIGEVVVDLGGECRPYIELAEPSYGVSDKSPFDIVLLTDHDAECKYYDRILNYKHMIDFEITGGEEHKKTDYELIEGKTTKLYVKCYDGYWDADGNTYNFELSVDSSKPVIHTYYAPKIIEYPLETVLVVGTDDKTICRYDTTEQDYELMENKFPDFDKNIFKDAHQATITIDSEEKNSYSYYVACMNRAEIVSDTKEITVNVDLDAEIEIEIITKKYNNESYVYLEVKTNKDSECFYGNTSSNIEERLGSGGYEHKTTISNLNDGTHTYHVECHSGGNSANEVAQFIVDTAPVNIPVVDDTSNIDDFPEYSYYTNKIRAKWELYERPLSGVDYFLYKIQDESENIIVNWTKSHDEDMFIWVDQDHNKEDLNLTEGTKYFFFVKASNRAGSVGQPGQSDGVIVDSLKKPATCYDDIQNGYETDTDCGGGICPECGLGKNCSEDSDCHSGFCNSSNMCAEPSCFDGVKNGDETDTDCGGSCDPCIEGKECEDNSDCTSGKCDGICIGVDSCSNNKLDEDETDVDCGGYCAEFKDKKCAIGKKCDEKSDCESGYCNEFNRCEEYTPPTPSKPTSDEHIKEEPIDDEPDVSESRFWPWFLLIIGIIFLVSGLLYLLVFKNKKKKTKPTSSFTTTNFKPIQPKPNPGNSYRPPPSLTPHESSIELRRKQAMDNLRKDRERFKEHDKIFSTFSSPKSDAGSKIHSRMDIGKTETLKQPEKTEKKKTTKKKTTKTVSSKKTKKPASKKEKRPKDVFEKLSVVATAELKKYKKKKK